MNPQNPKNGAHPDDTRNMIIFFIIAALLYVGYSHFVLQPQREAQLALQKAQQESALENRDGINVTSSTGVAGDKASSVSPRTREEVTAESPRLTFKNDHVFGSLSLTGGRLDDLSLQNYYNTKEREPGDHVVLLSPAGTTFPRYVDYGWAAQDKTIKTPDSRTLWRVSGNDVLTPNSPVTLVWNNGSGLQFERTISIDEQYVFTVTQAVINTSSKAVILFPYALAAQKGVPPEFQGRWISHEGPTGYFAEGLHDTGYKDLRKENVQTTQSDHGWIGFSDKYWLTAIMPEGGAAGKYSFKYSGTPKDESNVGRYQTDFVREAITVAPGASAEAKVHLYTGAKEVMVLQSYGEQLDVPHFDLAVDFGWLWFLSKPFFYGLHFIGKYVGNMGVAIILLTLLIRSSVFPLTNTSYKSFAKMKKVAPQVTELREKHGDNKAELQKNIMELYQKEGVNPMAGCFPMILQIPIFFALYKTLFVTIEIRHAPFFGWIRDLSAPDPTSIFNLFGLIPWSPPEFLMIGVWPCLMLVCMIIQRKLNPPPQDPIQRDMANYFPFVMTFILSKFGAGLVVYWTFSALIGVIQQMIIMRSQGVPIYLFGEYPGEDKLEDQVEKGPAVHPLVDMAEKEAENALFGDGDTSEEDKLVKVTPPKKKRPTKTKKSTKKPAQKPVKKTSTKKADKKSD